MTEPGKDRRRAIGAARHHSGLRVMVAPQPRLRGMGAQRRTSPQAGMERGDRLCRRGYHSASPQRDGKRGFRRGCGWISGMVFAWEFMYPRYSTDACFTREIEKRGRVSVAFFYRARGF
jgi:hypothetical protein